MLHQHGFSARAPAIAGGIVRAAAANDGLVRPAP